jgi:hypothetical protein
MQSCCSFVSWLIKKCFIDSRDYEVQVSKGKGKGKVVPALNHD